MMSTQQITKAMKMVAAAKLRKSQDRILQMRPYAKSLSAMLSSLASINGDSGPAWYNAPSKEENVLIVAISSDRGLCGSFNSNIFKATLKLIQEKYSAQQAQGRVTILPIGKKSLEYFTKRNMPVVSDYWDIFHSLSFEKVAAIGGFLMDSFKNGKFDKIEIVYNEFKNVASQILQVEQFLPVAPVQAATSGSGDYIFQPTFEQIIDALIPKLLLTQLYKAVLDSNASENGARMTAMDKATENAGDLIKDLRLAYNRTRQAAITKEILEIVAGAEALKAT